MAELTDEILMAFADGRLDKDTRARVEALLHQDAEARRRVEIFRATGAPIADLFRKTLEEPVPSHLVHFVRFYGGERPASARAETPVETLRSRGDGLWREALKTLTPLREGFSWRLAAATTAALVLGAGSGWLLHGNSVEIGGGQNASLDRGQIFAMGQFQQMLEKAPSGWAIRLSGSLHELTVARVSLTFKNKQGGYCREYELATPGAGQFTGLACRQSNGKWTLHVHVSEAIRGTPAEGVRADALEPIVNGMIEGNSFGKKEEAAVLANGWR